MTRRTLATLLLALTVLAGACASAEEVSGLGEFSTTDITVGDRAMTVAVAGTPEEREQGLMGVTDLEGLDGMLFVFPTDADTGFWMKDTLIPLDIAFFDVAGGFVDRFTMQPCTGDPCPTYEAAGSYRYALEAPAGTLAFVDATTILVLEG